MEYLEQKLTPLERKKFRRFKAKFAGGNFSLEYLHESGIGRTVYVKDCVTNTRKNITDYSSW